MKRFPTAYVATAIAVAIGLGVVAFIFYSLPDKDAPQELRKMASMPSTLDFSTTQPSYLKKFIVSVTSSLDPIAINTMHGWEILVKTPEGAPVDNAKISAIGGMPVHQHGLPTAPRVTKNLGDGRYRLEGVKFNMAGWWELKIKIDTGSDQDTATFNLILR